MIKKIGWLLLAAFVAIQFFPAKKNIAAPQSNTAALSSVLAVPQDVAEVLKTSCYDCHSNTTHYPWYSHIQPIGWWLQHHVDEGKQELNFDVFASYRLRRQYHKLEEIAEQVKAAEMPLNSYTLVHGDAKLSAMQQNLLTSWAAAQMDSMKAHYPLDSLIKKK
jgi:hypothetical protein